MSLLYVS